MVSYILQIQNLFKLRNDIFSINCCADFIISHKQIVMDFKDQWKNQQNYIRYHKPSDACKKSKNTKNSTENKMFHFLWLLTF